MLDVKCTRHESRPAQPSSRHVPVSRRLANAGPPAVQPAPRLAPNVHRAVPTIHDRAREVPTAIQRPTPRRREVSRHKARGTRSVPRGCPSRRRSARARDLAPVSPGAVQPAYRASSMTLPRLDWGRPSRARTSARTRCAHPGKASTASEPRGSAPSVLGTETAGTPYPRVPSHLGLLWLCTPAHRHTPHLDRNADRRFSRTIRTTEQSPRRCMRRSCCLSPIDSHACPLFLLRFQYE